MNKRHFISLIAVMLVLFTLTVNGMVQLENRHPNITASVYQSSKSYVDVTSYWSYPDNDKKTGELGQVFSVTATAYNLSGIEIKTFLAIDGKQAGSEYLFTPKSNKQEYTATPFLSRKEAQHLTGTKFQIEYRRSDDNSLVGSLTLH